MNICLLILQLLLLLSSLITAAYSMTSRKLSYTLNKDVMSQLMRRISEVNNADISRFIPFLVKGSIMGYVQPSIADILIGYKDVFHMNIDSLTDKKVLTFTPLLNDATSVIKTVEIAKITQELKTNGHIKGWRNELVSVTDSFSNTPSFSIERAAYPMLGVKGYGIHINGYTRDTSDHSISHLWVAKRSKTKSTWPSMYDHIVAGGQPEGISPIENVVKECGEEANIPSDLARKAISTGAVSYTSIDDDGNLKRDALFCYDLELPDSFTPTPVDGEVESFVKKDFDWVMSKLVAGGADGYKPNCNIVVIDFLIRNGIISSESHDYLKLVAMCRQGQCS